MNTALLYYSHLWICAWWWNLCSFSRGYWTRCTCKPPAPMLSPSKLVDREHSEGLRRSRYTQEEGCPPPHNSALFLHHHWCPVSPLQGWENLVDLSNTRHESPQTFWTVALDIVVDVYWHWTLIMRTSDVTVGGGWGPSAPSSSSASHRYRAPSSLLVGTMSRVDETCTGVAGDSSEKEWL